jgi:hypothetical protein
MLGRAEGQPKVFAQRRRRAKSHGRFHDDAAALRRSPIASATLVPAAKSLDARNIRARRTAVITDFLPDTFLGLLLGKAEALCGFLVPAGIHYASIGSGRNAANGPAANGPKRRT